VQPGDTLSSLALRYYGSAVFTRHLIENNLHIADPDRLTIGMVVKIPPAPAGVARRAPTPSKTAEARGPRTYTTKAGDSFYAIARDVLGDARRWKELLELNAHVVGGDPTRLQVGQVLVLPNR
jgi:nucleoid-associated protein YgaU